MKHKTYICIDDTDEIGSVISTGMLAKNLAEFIEKNYSLTTFISRHQLLIDDRIEYTSHNSSMCFTTFLTSEEKEKFIQFAINYLDETSVASAKPGFAICFEDEISDISEFIKYGLRAKSEVLEINDAFDEAKKQNISLFGIRKEHIGVIGALAGISLRLDGNDGRVKGKVKLKEGLAVVKEILENKEIEAVIDSEFKSLNLDERVLIKGSIKLIVKNSQAVLLVSKNKDGIYENQELEDLRKF